MKKKENHEIRTQWGFEKKGNKIHLLGLKQLSKLLKKNPKRKCKLTRKEIDNILFAFKQIVIDTSYKQDSDLSSIFTKICRASENYENLHAITPHTINNLLEEIQNSLNRIEINKIRYEIERRLHYELNECELLTFLIIIAGSFIAYRIPFKKQMEGIIQNEKLQEKVSEN